MRHLENGLTLRGLAGIMCAVLGIATLAVTAAHGQSRENGRTEDGIRIRAREVAMSTRDLVRAAIDDTAPDGLGRYSFLVTNLGWLAQAADDVIGDNGHDEATTARRVNALINSLGNTVKAATGIENRRVASSRARDKARQLAHALDALSTRLKTDVFASRPDADEATVPARDAPRSPAKRAAEDALALAEGTLADSTFIGPRLHTFLATNLDTLRLAAVSAIGDEGAPSATTMARNQALLSAVRDAANTAFEISHRPAETTSARERSAALSTSLRAIVDRLSDVITSTVPDSLTPVSVSATVRLATGRVTYHVGEEIPLALEFVGSGDRDFYFSTESCGRLSNTERYDVTPRRGRVEQPGDDRDEEPVVPCSGGKAPLDGRPFQLNVALNDWMRFTQPGTYSLAVESDRLRRMSGKAVDALRAAPIEFRIVPLSAEWVAGQVKVADGLIDGGVPVDVRRGAAMLRYLATETAARALVDRYDSVARVDRGEVIRGLMSSPYRSRIIARMEARLDLGGSLESSFISTLAHLRVRRDLSGAAMDADERRARTTVLYGEYEARWRAAGQTRTGSPGAAE